MDTVCLIIPEHQLEMDMKRGYIKRENYNMNHKASLVQLPQLSGPQLQHRLLVELDELIKKIEDGTVKENAFTGCIALEHRNLSPLSEKQSKQIKAVLSRSPLTPDQSEKRGLPILTSVFSFIRSLWGSHDTNAHTAKNGAKPIASLLDQNGRVRPKDRLSTGRGQNTHPANQEIQESDVQKFLAAQGDDFSWALPYAWDIANQLNAAKKSETEGDLSLFLERRRKLNVRRPKSTRFEQLVQRYAARVSELYCDENGDIRNKESLEAFIGDLVNTLLDKTKAYWPTSPLLAIFDGLVAPVFRPLLHKHQTFYFPSEVTTATGVIVSGSAVGKGEELVTVPSWNEASKPIVERYVKKAFKKHVWNIFLDRYAPYNRYYAKSPHLDAETLTNVGLRVRNFGNPIHLKDLMELLLPTAQADELAEYVVDHFRSSDFVDH